MSEETAVEPVEVDPFAEVKMIAADPDLISAFTVEQLEEARKQTAEFARSLTEGIETSENVDADIEALEEANRLDELMETRQTELATLATERAEKLTSLSARFTPEVEEAVEEPEPEPEVVVAAAPKLSAIAKRTPKISRPATRNVLTAAGDGTPIMSTRDLGQRMLDTFEAAKHSNGSGRGFETVARFSTEGKYPYTATDSPSENFVEYQRMLRDVSSRDASARALTAAGFSAPATPVYDFFSISTEDGLIQLPTFNATRGRVTFPVSPSFDDIYTSAAASGALGGDSYTGDDDENGISKTVYTPANPSSTDCEVAGRPKILRHSNFDQLFNPEFVAHWAAESMRAHAHLVNEDHIIALVALATAVGGGDPGGGTLVNVTQVVAFEAERYRDKYRMAINAPLTLIAPAWLEDALATDMVARLSTIDYGNAKARTGAIWANMNIDVQYVYDWQGLLGWGGWPTTVDLLFYAPGTFVKTDGGSIDLGIVRDSTKNLTNDFETFYETFEGVCMPGHEAILINDLTVCPNGDASDGGDITCAVGS